MSTNPVHTITYKYLQKIKYNIDSLFNSQNQKTNKTQSYDNNMQKKSKAYNSKIYSKIKLLLHTILNSRVLKNIQEKFSLYTVKIFFISFVIGSFTCFHNVLTYLTHHFKIFILLLFCYAWFNIM